MNTTTKPGVLTRHEFGPLQFTVEGRGVFCMSDRLRDRIAAMPADDLRAANREAWRKLRPLVRQANRENNVSVYGWNDSRDQAIEVCEAVCKATWRAIQGGAA